MQRSTRTLQDAILSRADFDDSHWAAINIGQAWEDQGYVGYDEGAWYRARIEVDAEEGRPVHLAFGGVDNNAYVYVNGTFVGEHHGWNHSFHPRYKRGGQIQGPERGCSTGVRRDGNGRYLRHHRSDPTYRE